MTAPQVRQRTFMSIWSVRLYCGKQRFEETFQKRIKLSVPKAPHDASLLKLPTASPACTVGFQSAFGGDRAGTCEAKAAGDSFCIRLQAAGVIHSDFEKAFIRAETFACVPHSNLVCMPSAVPVLR